MSTLSLRLDDNDSELIKYFAQLKNLSVSELIRSTVIERIEDELDIDLFEKAMNEMKRTYSLDEVKKELGL